MTAHDPVAVPKIIIRYQLVLMFSLLFSFQWLLLCIEYHPQPNHNQLHRPSGCHIGQWILSQQCVAGGGHVSEQRHRRAASGINSRQVNTIIMVRAIIKSIVRWPTGAIGALLAWAYKNNTWVVVAHTLCP